jgi:truncated hemoglobin YjbI
MANEHDHSKSGPRDPRELPLLLSKPELRDLYVRLGATPEAREQRLADILKDFYRLMSTDLLIGFFFDNKDVDAIALTQKDFLMRAFGARATYKGKAPADAHTQLAPILEGHFNRRLQLLDQTLHKHGLSEEDIKNWLTFENAFRDGIVNG